MEGRTRRVRQGRPYRSASNAVTATRADWLAKSDDIRHLTRQPRTALGSLEDQWLDIWNGPGGVQGDVEVPVTEIDID